MAVAGQAAGPAPPQRHQLPVDGAHFRPQYADGIGQQAALLRRRGNPVAQQRGGEGFTPSFTGTQPQDPGGELVEPRLQTGVSREDRRARQQPIEHARSGGDG
ncbi:hypothetical protein K9U14_24455 [Streptomyces griseocarneus]|nr:hypothetical protein [Streptomyces griseocarneus]